MTAPPVPAGLNDGCAGTSPTIAPSFGAVHTIPPRPEPVNYELAVAPSRVCPGGQLRVAVRITNRSSRSVKVAPNVIMSGATFGRNYAGCCDFVSVPPRGLRTVLGTITIPLSMPLGRQGLGFRDFDPGDGDGVEFDVIAANA